MLVVSGVAPGKRIVIFVDAGLTAAAARPEMPDWTAVARRLAELPPGPNAAP